MHFSLANDLEYQNRRIVESLFFILFAAPLALSNPVIGLVSEVVSLNKPAILSVTRFFEDPLKGFSTTRISIEASGAIKLQRNRRE